MTDHQPRNVVRLPLLQGGSIEDTLSGFARQIDADGRLGRRVEHSVSVVAVEIRGWNALWDRLGSDQAGQALQQTVDRVIGSLEELGGQEISLGGEATQPVITVTFTHDDHPLMAVVAAQRSRDETSRSMHPSLPDRFHACIGVNTGVVIDTHVNGSGLDFQSFGTTRMFALRLQEFAGPDQVFVSDATYQAIPARLDVVPIGSVRTSGDGETQEAYFLRGMLSDDLPR